MTRSRFAVIGHPIAHSRSPDIHQAFAKQFGIDLLYERIDADPDQFEAVVEAFFKSGGSGLNITVPFKERAWQMAQQSLSQRAADAQAVNTLWMQGDKLCGCNTDGVGLVSDLKRLGMLTHEQSILLLGAGGASRGVLGPLLASGCAKLHVANRTATRALDLVEQWARLHPADAQRLSASGLELDTLPGRWDLVINATASSLQGDSIALPESLLADNAFAYDMMYSANDTPFMLAARRAGAVGVSDGLGMLVGQAAESFRLWHGQMPTVEPVVQSIRANLKHSVR